MSEFSPAIRGLTDISRISPEVRPRPITSLRHRQLTQCERLLDHRIGAGNYRCGNLKSDCLCSLEINNELEGHRLRDG